ncbi:hypothetical protein M413DRAFT_24874 [Hebeloma cylindrosporum]|uniref:DUF6589 domain-containing protein n=1 Tax=Hebeloma cylindrosporum TaxID=76867 RepID=A0A0C2YXQ9_HEBCY|nr:hypothetical protein M413DRAFT_24874 [Hebeloma cylindrosporum h7]
MGQVQKIAGEEAGAISREGILSKTNKVINEAFFLDYSISGLTSTLRSLAPNFFSLLDAFSITSRQKSQLSEKWAEKKRIMEGSAVLTLLKSRSQTNNYAQAIHGMYLMATGAQRQHFSVLSSLGITVGYGNVIDQRKPGKATATTKKPRKRTPGTLFQLSQACRETARRIASSALYVTVYDNINMMVRVAEQIVGCKNAQENGTCVTIMPLHNAKLEDLAIKTLDERIKNARPLRLEDLELTEPESDLMDDALVYTILSIIVTHGGEGFEKWSENLKDTRPCSSNTIDVHQTPIHPLPAMEIDESTITGNVEIIEAITNELYPDSDHEISPEYVKIIAGDQLTIARQRSILNIRVGHEDGADSWKNIVLMPGLFHAKIADCHGLLTVHFGKSSTRSPGSLAFHNTCLDRLPILLSSLPSFRVCRDLIMVSLYARVLHLLLQVSNMNTVEEYLAKYRSWSDVQTHAKMILELYADAGRVQELRQPRETAEHQRIAKIKAEQDATKSLQAAARALARKGPVNPSISPVPAAAASVSSSKLAQSGLKKEDQGDMVFENAVLFMRDALFTRLFADAVKAGDSGLVILMLKMWTFSYRGSGRSKYAHELLHLFHNLVNVWSEDLRYVITQNWLLNPTGKPNAFVEIDLVQEHLNFWVKKIYKADGDSHSWDWLSLVSPCIDVLRRLSTKLNVELGSRQGKTHSVPDLQKDIHALMGVLKEHEVYVVKLGRGLDANDTPAPDILSAGLSALSHGTTTNPLSEFNAQYDRLRERRNMTPVSALAHDNPSSNAAQQSSPTMAPSPIMVDSDPSHEGANESDDGLEFEDEDQISDFDEFEVESPTLMRFEEDDVALDMDEMDLGIEFVDEDGLDSEEDENDGDF